MQRKVFFLALLSASAAPVMAQQGTREVAVTAERRKIDSLRSIMDWRTLTVDEVKALSADYKKQVERLMTAREEMQRQSNNGTDADKARIELTQRMMQGAVGDLLAKQRVLLEACNILAPRPDDPTGFLGFQINRDALDAAGPDDARFARIPEVVFVQPGTPAAKEGIREGDQWIAFDGRPVLNALKSELNARLKMGVSMELRLKREGRDLTVPLMPAARPAFPDQDCNGADHLQVMTFNNGGSAQSQVKIFRGPAPPTAGAITGGFPGIFTMKVSKLNVQGASFSELTNEKRDAFPKVPANEGVLVDSIYQNSPAESAGLRPFDVVTKVNNQAVGSLGDLAKLISQPGAITLTVIRGDTQRQVTMPGR